MSTEILDLIPTICFSKFCTLKVELGKVGGFGAASVAVFVRRAPPRVLQCVSLMLRVRKNTQKIHGMQTNSCKKSFKRNSNKARSWFPPQLTSSFSSAPSDTINVRSAGLVLAAWLPLLQNSQTFLKVTVEARSGTGGSASQIRSGWFSARRRNEGRAKSLVLPATPAFSQHNGSRVEELWFKKKKNK